MTYGVSVGENICFVYPMDLASSYFHPLHVPIHECVHGYQKGWEKRSYNAFDPFDLRYMNEENASLIYKETYFLAQYIQSQNKTWLSYYLAALQQRQQKSNQPHVLEHETSKMEQEGLADYPTVQVLKGVGIAPEDYYSTVERIENKSKDPIAFVADLNRYYLNGYALALALDRLGDDTDWKTKIEKGESTLLELFFTMCATQDIQACSYNVSEDPDLNKKLETFLTSFTKANQERIEKFEKHSLALYQEEGRIPVVIRQFGLFSTGEACPLETHPLNSDTKIVDYKYHLRGVRAGEEGLLSLRNQYVLEGEKRVTFGSFEKFYGDYLVSLHSSTSVNLEDTETSLEKWQASSFEEIGGLIQGDAINISNIKPSGEAIKIGQKDSEFFLHLKNPYVTYMEKSRYVEGKEHLVVHFLSRD
jgi:hypothetical protein